jgi:cystathionine beta-lyase
MSSMPYIPRGAQSRLVHAGSGTAYGVVNTPIHRASTLLFESVADYERAASGPGAGTAYARYGTATTRALEAAINEAECGCAAMVLPSGLAAITVALMAVLEAGSHVLVSDSVYSPTRRLCLQTLARFGVETTFFDPSAGADLAALFRPTTRAVFLESPGSVTFEVQDVALLSDLARARGCKVLMDNTWATPLFFNPLRHGVDLVIHSATKYLAGHSDALMGLIVAGDRELGERVRGVWAEMGQTAGPDDCFLALRGLRTLGVRMRRHFESAMAVAEWLAAQPQVASVLYPALPQSPGHALWKRDFSGASGLFGLHLRTGDPTAASRLADSLELFGIGASWGAHESLILPVSGAVRSIGTSTPTGLLRVHVGLEDADDLIRDLAQGLRRLDA